MQLDWFVIENNIMKKVKQWYVNNSTNINKGNNYFSPQIIEPKKRP
jgi:hypothetical protein